MACHNPPLKKAKNQCEIPLLILSPIPFTFLSAFEHMKCIYGLMYKLVMLGAKLA